MRIRIIKTREEYNIACERVYEIINSSEKPTEPNSIKCIELKLLSILIENYEKGNFLIEAPSPIEAKKFRMDQMNRKQADILP